ncbi:Uu.00g022170.m01.CDS01 [Anthostomella pinea]|uniref:Uu.00g022170.m01.CDS01 n=1 Tax=Anthostomella pinea TaxID=933095 RepID=A0AAI8W110_9PEZI|nr:Uu.00g022170.m01.CDS01 [Anthostomella pinea]
MGTAAFVRLLSGRQRNIPALNKALRQRLLDHRAKQSMSPAQPMILAFEPAPAFHLGRAALDCRPSQLLRLESDLRLPQSRLLRSDSSRAEQPEPVDDTTGKPECHIHDDQPRSMYYGPGQAVVWPILDLQSRASSLATWTKEGLEQAIGDATVSLLRERFDLPNSFRRDDSGVWVSSASSAAQHARQIASVKVQVRGGIASLGVALNLDLPTSSPPDTNPWARLAALRLGTGTCVTRVAAEIRGRSHRGFDGDCVVECLAYRISHHPGLDATEGKPNDAFQSDPFLDVLLLGVDLGYPDASTASAVARRTSGNATADESESGAEWGESDEQMSTTETGSEVDGVITGEI